MGLALAGRAAGLLWLSVLLVSSATSSALDFSNKVHDVLDRAGRKSILQSGTPSDLTSSSGRSMKGREYKIDLSNLERILGVKLNQENSGGEILRKSRADTAGSAGILGTLSEQGLVYVKEVLVNEILAEVTPLDIPDIITRVNSPIGRVDTTITQIVLSGATVHYSDIELGQTGITIYAAGIKASLVMDWRYQYTATYVPFPVQDGGRAEVEVTGMQAGATFSMSETNGTLTLHVEECGTYIENLEITLHGGASWLYQWFVYAFDAQIRTSVETQITKQMTTGAEQLDNWLLHLPRRVPIDDTSAIDVTVVHDPLLSPTFLSVGAKGEFVSLVSPKPYPEPDTELPAGLFCDQSVKMLTIALSDYVLNSAGFVYYDSGFLQWDVDELPGKKYLNTASWKYIIPQLYKKYPNEDMVLNFAVSAPPKVVLSRDGISSVTSADMTIKVKDATTLEQTPVACISLAISMDAIADLDEGNITAQATLNDLTVSLKWSDVGNFPVYLVQATVRTIVKDVVVPLLNLNLRRGFPLPVVAGVTLQNSDLRYEDGYIMVCTDIHYKGGFFHLKKLGEQSGTSKLVLDQ
ncbi:hypothetical protein MPTK1_7g12170 [Marchantia polymorpha subsp. ruderalis]|uniref:Lipid-binding serum glycoprotein C-terminal domain-containing protein n=2 Tax=Marchantia polymorpha TaxID=3197 RepID=A0AAF6BYN9_MARPO|nr:hypothetical protein MARPO_0003s0230 [Marchantia polymorpha]BBN17123.1 hypothetical protein Mp_7g12170 [Marchantia polymorpha subsp. ruderalis]|eukprot:PTQ49362.1 hypothetical protein MARPO_0003s0230 [Marchantia polymorpha]